MKVSQAAKIEIDYHLFPNKKAKQPLIRQLGLIC